MAHTVKGISGYMGARRLFQTAKDLEDILKRGGSTHGENLIQPFVDALDEVLTSLAGLSLNVPGPRDEKAVSKTFPLDFDDLICRLETLIDSLHQGEYASGELFSELEEILTGHGHDDLLGSIGVLIDDIEYSDAAGVAGGLKETLHSQKQGQGQGR
jgi:HPt (histidine-containing phosphotransfer) domain-containing protein